MPGPGQKGTVLSEKLKLKRVVKDLPSDCKAPSSNPNALKIYISYIYTWVHFQGL
jgi:hypothetical protein